MNEEMMRVSWELKKWDVRRESVQSNSKPSVLCQNIVLVLLNCQVTTYTEKTRNYEVIKPKYHHRLCKTPYGRNGRSTNIDLESFVLGEGEEAELIS